MTERIKVKEIPIGVGKTVTIELNPETGKYRAELVGIRARGYSYANKVVERASLRDIEREIDKVFGANGQVDVMTDYNHIITVIGAEKPRNSWHDVRARRKDGSFADGPLFVADEPLMLEIQQAERDRKAANEAWDIKIRALKDKRIRYSLASLKAALQETRTAPAEPSNEEQQKGLSEAV